MFMSLVETPHKQLGLWSSLNMVDPLPAPIGEVDGWILASVPELGIFAKEDLLFLHNGTYYTWAQAISNDNEENTPLIVNFIYGWNYVGKHYDTVEEVSGLLGYWIFLYFDDVRMYASIPGGSSSTKFIIGKPGVNVIC